MIGVLLGTIAALSWEIPTKRIDGSILHPYQIAYYRLERNESPYESTTGTSTTITLPGRYCVRVIDTDGLESACSNVLNIKRKDLRGKR